MGYKIESNGVVNFYVPHARMTSILNLETAYKFEDVSLPEGGEDGNSDLFDANSVTEDEKYFVYNAIKSLMGEVWKICHRLQPGTIPGYFNQAQTIPNWRNNDMDPEGYVEAPLGTTNIGQVKDVCSGFYVTNKSQGNAAIYQTIDILLEETIRSGCLAKWYYTKNRADDFSVQNTVYITNMTLLNNLLYKLYKYDLPTLNMTS